MNSISNVMRSVPWLVTDSRNRIEGIIGNRQIDMLEFGAGGSTIFYGSKPNVRLITFEHDKTWFDKISAAVDSDIRLYPRPYTNNIDSLEDGQFDIILVDGRDRVNCMIKSLPKLKPGGFMVLDNAERPQYKRGIDLLTKLSKDVIHYKQPKADETGFNYPNWTTTIWHLDETLVSDYHQSC